VNSQVSGTNKPPAPRRRQCSRHAAVAEPSLELHQDRALPRHGRPPPPAPMLLAAAAAVRRARCVRPTRASTSESGSTLPQARFRWLESDRTHPSAT
jgi:hypothetical protein